MSNASHIPLGGAEEEEAPHGSFLIVQIRRVARVTEEDTHFLWFSCFFFLFVSREHKPFDLRDIVTRMHSNVI